MGVKVLYSCRRGLTVWEPSCPLKWGAAETLTLTEVSMEKCHQERLSTLPQPCAQPHMSFLVFSGANYLKATIIGEWHKEFKCSCWSYWKNYFWLCKQPIFKLISNSHFQRVNKCFILLLYLQKKELTNQFSKTTLTELLKVIVPIFLNLELTFKRNKLLDCSTKGNLNRMYNMWVCTPGRANIGQNTKLRNTRTYSVMRKDNSHVSTSI